jgi:transcriptional regulator with XRE-family HTH domain/Zn-dependent peptidase ImmA (M78 family)
MGNWDNIDYQKIISATINGEMLSVGFADGAVVKLAFTTLLPPQSVDIDKTSLSFSDYEICFNASPEDLVIPWDRIRVLTDADFAKEMVKQAEDNNMLTGKRLKALREKKNMKSSDLAAIAGLTPQTISRIERGHTDVSFGTLRKILAAMGYSLKDLATQEVLTESSKAVSTFSEILRKLNKLGIETAIINKILPSEIRDQLAKSRHSLPELLVNEIAFHINRVFGWNGLDIIKNDRLHLNEKPAQLAYFKTPSKGNINQIKAYSHYAFYIAKIVNNINIKQPVFEYPGDLKEFKIIFYKKYQILNLENLINYVWDLGISVIPLNDQGVFHGASWNINGKHVVVLKQRNRAHARWIFDLLHELYHVFVHLESNDTSVIEVEELNPFANNESEEEKEANAFADQFIFDHKAEEIVHKSLENAGYRLDQLKKATIAISNEMNIRADFIANYLAFRLQMNDKNWWGTANSLQITDPDPFNIVKQVLSQRVSTENLNSIDRNLLASALN